MSHVYATSTETAKHCGLSNPGAQQLAQLDIELIAASKFIDNACSQWFDKRYVKVTTEASEEATSVGVAYMGGFGLGQRELFMPGRIISVDSITEDGELLDPSEYHLYSFWIEKDGKTFWTTLQRSIVVIGYMGYASVPEDIKSACMEIAGIWSGLKKNDYIDGNGIAQATTIRSLPKWVQSVLASHMATDFHNQVWTVEEVTDPNADQGGS